MSLTIVGFLNLTVAIIDHQFSPVGKNGFSDYRVNQIKSVYVLMEMDLVM